MGNVINEFRGPYYFLSNMYPCAVKYGEFTYMNAESAFQAQKCPMQALRFVGVDGYDAKKMGRAVVLRVDWNDVKVTIMHEIVEQKFRQTPDLRRKLIALRGCNLVEGNTWRDTFWGVYNGKGENHLGKILMEVADTLAEEDEGEQAV